MTVEDMEGTEPVAAETAEAEPTQPMASAEPQPASAEETTTKATAAVDDGVVEETSTATAEASVEPATDSSDGRPLGAADTLAEMANEAVGAAEEEAPAEERHLPK